MGLALLIVILKTHGAPRRATSTTTGRRGSGRRIFALNFAMGVVTGHPDGVPVRHELGALLQGRRRRHRPDARHGRRVLLLPGVELPRPVPLRREAAGTEDALVGGVRASSSGAWLSGFFIIATNAWMQHPVGYVVGAGRAGPAGQLLGAAREPLGALAVPPQHDRVGRHRRVRRGVDRGLLPAARACTRPTGGPSCGSASRPAWSARCSWLSPPATRRARTSRRYQPATLAAMEGLFETHEGRAAGHRRAARRGEEAARQPDRRSRGC